MHKRARRGSADSLEKSIITGDAIPEIISITLRRAWLSSKQVIQIFSCLDSMNTRSGRCAAFCIYIKHKTIVLKYFVVYISNQPFKSDDHKTKHTSCKSPTNSEKAQLS